MTPALPENTNGNLGTESVLGQASGLRLSISLSNDLESLVEVAGVEPASRDSSKTASTHVVFLMFLSSVQEGTPTEPRLPSTVYPPIDSPTLRGFACFFYAPPTQQASTDVDVQHLGCKRFELRLEADDVRFAM